MLLRDFHEMLRAAEVLTSAAYKGQAAVMRGRLERAMRFMFRGAATEAAAQIAARPEQLDAAREQLFPPFPDCWLEFEGLPHAILWQGDADDPRAGGAIAVSRDRGQLALLPFRVDLRRMPYITIPPEASALAGRARAQGVPAPDFRLVQEMGVPLDVGRTMLAAWALLASKGMTASVRPDLSRLNAARRKRGLYPLLAYQEIRLNLDAERAVRAHLARGSGQMPLHPVRAHLRLLPTGRVTIVSAHMRGNPEYGVRGHHYTVMRDEDRDDR